VGEALADGMDMVAIAAPEGLSFAKEGWQMWHGNRTVSSVSSGGKHPAITEVAGHQIKIRSGFTRLINYNARRYNYSQSVSHIFANGGRHGPNSMTLYIRSGSGL
jgi:hypothetical protein